MTRLMLSASLVAALLVPHVTRAQMDPDQAAGAAETRQAVLRLMGWNMGPLGAMARDRMPFDGDRVATNAERLVALTGMMADAFAPDTRGASVKTEALDVIWEKPEDFAQKIADARSAAADLVEASGTGDEGAMRSAIGAMGQTCGACHDNYKVD